VFVAAEDVGRVALTVRVARNPAEVEAAQRLRVRVFCDEQGVAPEVELDGRDMEATHIIALEESRVLATCRLRFLDERICKLERMAVDRRFRKLGVGGKLLAVAEQEASLRGAAEVLLNAQLSAEPFYASHGYRAEGERFMEAGIEHVAMRKAL
jgi:predicted GNAT family N-acyltransferase